MKINVEIDCSPEEARRFLGLPDVSDANAAMVEAMTARMTEAIATMQPDELMTQWVSGGLKGMEDMQKTFWQQMTAAAGSPGEKDE